MILRLIPLLLILVETSLLAQTLILVAPNAGKQFGFKDTMVVHWTGVSATTPVRIELSDDGGLTFTEVADSATGNVYRLPVPDRAGSRYKIRVTSYAHTELVRTFTGPGKNGWHSPAVIHPSGDIMASVVRDTLLDQPRIWIRRVNTGELLFSLEHYEHTIPTYLQFHGWGNLIASAMESGKVVIWDARNGRLVHLIDAFNATADGVAFSPDGAYMATIGDDIPSAIGLIKIWDVASGRRVRTIRGQNGRGWTVKYSPDGRYLVSSSMRGQVRIWDAVTGDSVRVIKGRGTYLSATFSPDQSLVAASNDEGEIFLYDVATGAERALLRGNRSRVQSVEFSADGRLLLSGAGDGTARVWDLATGDSIAVLRGTLSWVSSAVFTARGQILTGSYDATARIWDFSAPSSDTSDGTFTISPYSYHVRDIDFGQVRVGTTRDSTVEAYICNDGTEPILLREIVFPDDDDIYDFALQSNVSFPLQIGPGECRALTFSFTPASDNARSIRVRFVIGSDTLYAEFRGQGTLTSSVEQSALAGEGLRVWPSPSREATTVEYSLARTADVDLQLVDSRGEIVWRQSGKNVPAGNHSLALDVSDKPAGIYWLILESGKTTLKRKLLVVR